MPADPRSKDVKLSCRNVWKIYGQKPQQFFKSDISDPVAHAQMIRDADHIVASADVSFDVHVGEIFVIMGLSGSGKSTIVRCLSRLVEPTAGEILLDGEDLLKAGKKELIDFRRNKMGMVFQNFGLMPHLNVIDNVAFPVDCKGVALKERRAQAQEVISLVGLEGREASFPSQLSGGQQQRVGIARSLAVKPELWFLDEPFSALDPLIRRQMQDEFLRLQRELHKSIVFITHDFLEALRIADRMAIMRNGEVVQIGRPVDLILNPADDYVKEFTNDVPWEMVLTAGDIADPDRGFVEGMGRITADTSVEKLLPYLAEHELGVMVHDGKGTDLGGLNARSVVKALATAPTGWRSPMREHSHALTWFALAAVSLVLYLTSGPLAAYPDAWIVSPTQAMNTAMRAFTDTFGPGFKAVGWLLEWPIRWAQALLAFLPWSVTATIFIGLGYIASGPRLAIFVLIAMLYMAGIGYWAESMNSLAIVLISVPMAIAVGFSFGVWGFYSERARRAIMPMLDLLQTIPAFAYLLPILILFGFGTTVGLVASILFAFPPMVRNTILGLRTVNPAVIEAGLMSGATPGQLFWKVRVPAAQNQMLLGVNQTTMASLSMVIIASIIGGTNDIGWEVLQTMRKAQFGESLLSGFVIALMAMALDRITYGFAKRDRFAAAQARVPVSFIVAGAAVVMAVLSLAVPFLRTWPETLVFYPAKPMNDALEYMVINWRTGIETLKNSAFFYVMLPIKIGLSKAVSPFTWGFAMTPVLTIGYGIVIAALAAWAGYAGRWTMAAVIVLLGVMSFIGLTNMPWIALIAVLAYGAYSAGGKGLALGTIAALGFLLLAGIWPQTVLSLYLCGIAVALAFGFGATIGVWASMNDTVSAIVRPIIDTLQTMPLFVILIPFVMIFKIGEFTALLAVIAYAIVPAIRYTEHGLRNLPEHVIEAATTIGCTPMQLLWRVKLPLALPALMLGLNQTIIYGIAMLVIAALVGTNGLGQQILYRLGRWRFRCWHDGRDRHGGSGDHRRPRHASHQPPQARAIRAEVRADLNRYWVLRSEFDLTPAVSTPMTNSRTSWAGGHVGDVEVLDPDIAQIKQGQSAREQLAKDHALREARCDAKAMRAAMH